MDTCKINPVTHTGCSLQDRMVFFKLTSRHGLKRHHEDSHKCVPVSQSSCEFSLFVPVYFHLSSYLANVHIWDIVILFLPCQCHSNLTNCPCGYDRGHLMGVILQSSSSSYLSAINATAKTLFLLRTKHQRFMRKISRESHNRVLLKVFAFAPSTLMDQLHLNVSGLQFPSDHI